MTYDEAIVGLDRPIPAKFTATYLRDRAEELRVLSEGWTIEPRETMRRMASAWERMAENMEKI